MPQLEPDVVTSFPSSLSLSDPLAIAGDGDPALEFYFDRINRAVPRVLARIAPQLSPNSRGEIDALRTVFEALPIDARRRTVTHPYFSYWWHALMERCLSKNRLRVEEWLPDLGRFLILPAAGTGFADGVPFRLRVRHGEIRFPGYANHIRLDGCEEGAVPAAVHGDVLTVQSGGRRSSFELAALFGDPEAGTDPRLRKRAFLPGTETEIDCSDPWVQDLFRSINSREPISGLPPRDLTPIDPLSEELIGWFQDAADLIEQVWPELMAELKAYTRLVVPFRSNCYSSFTEAAFMGAVFLSEGRHSFQSTLFSAEHLFHEHSHLRLALLLELDPLMRSDDPDQRIWSPARHEPRPLKHFLQAIFVFARIARFMRRAAAITGEPAFGERAARVAAELRESMEALDRTPGMHYTSLGNRLLDAIREEAHSA